MYFFIITKWKILYAVIKTFCKNQYIFRKFECQLDGTFILYQNKHFEQEVGKQTKCICLFNRLTFYKSVNVFYRFKMLCVLLGTRKTSHMPRTLLIPTMYLCCGRAFWKGRVHCWCLWLKIYSTLYILWWQSFKSYKGKR